MKTVKAIPGVAKDTFNLLSRLGVKPNTFAKGNLEVRSPITGQVIGPVSTIDPARATAAIDSANETFLMWRNVPPPRRGEILGLFADELCSEKVALGRLVTLEAGKILSEGIGEVQEMIDICTYASGLSRQNVCYRNVH